MSDLEARMHQNRFWLGLCPKPCWGSLQCSPYLLTGFRDPTYKGREEGEAEGKEERGRERRGRERDEKKERKGRGEGSKWAPPRVGVGPPNG